MFNIVAVSDTHNQHFKLDIPKSGDLFIHAGDFTCLGQPSEVIKFNAWLSTLDYKYKIVVPGNHDILFEKDEGFARQLLTNAKLLIDQEETIYINKKKISIYGSPWQPEFCNWAFNLPRGKQLRDKWERIPKNTDILITHGPPLGIGDILDIGQNAGCADLLDRVKDIKPKLHIFGHIHSAHGKYTLPNTNIKTEFYNVAICEEKNLFIQRPTVIHY